MTVEYFRDELQRIRDEGLYKQERIITTPQGVAIETLERGAVLNFCANNYLGFANHPAIVEAAIQGIRAHGYGLASVRFICGTQEPHRQLEGAIARFLGTDDAILYSSCFDANTGLFETLLGPEDAVLSDALNHASIIDGIRLCKATRYRYAHSDMDDLEAKLREAGRHRIRLVVTDGVFSMDGDLARLDHIVALARRYDALVMVDDSHATGVLGATGRGSAEHWGVQGAVDIFTSTLGKALGGGTGGFTAARAEIVELLRQRSRPYLFSNTLAPAQVAAGLKALELVDTAGELRARLHENTRHFRTRMTEEGFDIKPGDHPIVPVMIYDAELAQRVAADLLAQGIYVVAFSYPVVPRGEARIRVQISAAHERGHLDRAVEAFKKARKALDLVD
jgi:glycine C-acetyltransferase